MPEESIQERQQRLASTPRACEACKLRKIRCDRNYPCSNCQSSGIACQKPTPRREQQPNHGKIAQLEERVRRLEARIVALESKPQSQHPLIPSTSTPAYQKAVREPDDSHDVAIEHNIEEPYEGPSSFTAQSFDAHQIACGAAEAQGRRHSQDNFLMVQTLLDITASQLVMPFGNLTSSPGMAKLPEMSPVPVEIVIAIVKEIKRKTPVFLRSWVIDDASLIEILCRGIYFPTEPLSVGHLTSTYGILYSVGKELLLTQNPLCNDFDIHAFVQTCEGNFDMGLKTYDILAQPSFENILGLTLGIIKTYNQSRSFICSTLLSSAITHCQLLGYHRESTYTKKPPVERNNTRRLFWTLYVFEKTISLILGRPPKLHDFDIDTKCPEPSISPGAKPWDESFIAFIGLAKLQGQIYQSFYSAEGSVHPVPVKMGYADSLSAALEQWKSDLDSIDIRQADHAQIFDLSRIHWNLIYLSTKTLILRGPSTGKIKTEISQECYDVARQSLQSCVECFQSYQQHGVVPETEFANSFLLFVSFTPFITTFIHSITALDTEDVILLKRIADIMERMQDASQEIKRTHRICSAFSSLASSFVETKVSEPTVENVPEYGISQLSQTPWHALLHSDFFRDFLGTDLHDEGRDGI
ncbi:fungal-specific transcription factor domain-containing protein [Hypomontagnella monticulosa]|nr:fungal-specific transcription factor domain-containing protein [Hypomontagnella monticulosa]